MEVLVGKYAQGPSQISKEMINVQRAYDLIVHVLSLLLLDLGGMVSFCKSNMLTSFLDLPSLFKNLLGQLASF